MDLEDAVSGILFTYLLNLLAHLWLQYCLPLLVLTLDEIYEIFNVNKNDPQSLVGKTLKVVSSFFDEDFASKHKFNKYYGKITATYKKRVRGEDTQVWDVLWKADNTKNWYAGFDFLCEYLTQEQWEFCKDGLLTDYESDEVFSGLENDDEEDAIEEKHVEEEKDDVFVDDEKEPPGFVEVIPPLVCQPPRLPRYKQKSQPKSPIGERRGWKPKDYFTHFMTRAIVDNIVEESNDYKDRKEYGYRDLSNEEFLRWLGLVMIMCVVNMPNLDNYWSTFCFGSINMVCFAHFMSRKRWYHIKRMLHLYDETTALGRDHANFDHAQKLGLFENLMRERFRSVWVPGRENAVDEKMQGYGGRTPCKRKIPGKPGGNDEGHKFYVWCCSTTYYIIDFFFDSKSYALVDIFRKLLRPTMKKGLIFFCDRFYTTADVVNWFWKHKMGYVGTTKVKAFKKMCKDGYNLCENRYKTEREKKDNRGVYHTFFNDIVMLFYWIDNGVCLLTSTCYSSVATTVKGTLPDGTVGERNAPMPIKHFRKYMGGVDRMDQVSADWYSVAKRIRCSKWWLKVFLGIIDMALYNAYILWKYDHPDIEKPSHVKWWMEVAEGLIGYEKVSRYSVAQRHHRISKLTKNDSGRVKQVRCQGCDKTSTTSYGCRICNVGLHTQCFDIYHYRNRDKPPRVGYRLVFEDDEDLGETSDSSHGSDESDEEKSDSD